MSKCPNDDPQFQKLLENIGMLNKTEDTVLQRRRIYYTICIFVRLAIAGLVFQLREKKWMPYAIGVVALLSIAKLYTSIKDPGNQWWSKRFALVIAILLLLSAILIKYEKIPSSIPSILIVIGVVGGGVQSLFIKAC